VIAAVVALENFIPVHRKRISRPIRDVASTSRRLILLLRSKTELRQRKDRARKRRVCLLNFGTTLARADFSLV